MSKKAKAQAAATHQGGTAPKGWTDMQTLRKLKLKYSPEQLAWCTRRLPAGLLT